MTARGNPKIVGFYSMSFFEWVGKGGGQRDVRAFVW